MKFKVCSDIESEIRLFNEFEFSMKMMSVEGTEQNKDIIENQLFDCPKDCEKFMVRVQQNVTFIGLLAFMNQ